MMDVFSSEFDYNETSNWKELIDFAVAAVGLTALDTISTGRGGNEEGW